MSTPKTLTLDSTSLFLNSFKYFSESSSQTPPPLSFSLLSQHSALPPIPSNFSQSNLIPKTRFIVDGFRSSGDFSVTYFLSHFHSDHYTGLNPSWCKGLIFCSEITARLLVETLKIAHHFVVSLPLGEFVKIDGCDVALVDANHCPGAVQFLFKISGSDGREGRYVHTGDFRYCDSMKLDPILTHFVGADSVFLDTTYCNPKFVFPSQDESIDYIVKTIQRIKVETESVLFLIATYVVGKEKILLEISRRCDSLVHVDSKKLAVLGVLGLGECGFFTEDASKSIVHVIGWNVLGETWPYFRSNFAKMKEIMSERGYSKAVGFVPTGWMYETKRDGFAVGVKDCLEIHLVPYSEHSSYNELREYIRFLRPKRVVPTVGFDVEKLDSKHATAMRKHFTGLVDEMANKHEFLMGFHRKSLGNSGTDGDDVGNDLNMIVKMEKEVEEPSKCTDTGFDSESMSCKQEPLNDKDIDEKIQELRDCLPKWTTRDQMLDLLSKSGGDIVEAVSDFYERETELHEQAISSSQKSSLKDFTKTELHEEAISSSQTSFVKDSTKDTLCGSETRILSQENKFPKGTTFVKASASPKKRGASLKNKPTKKARLSSAVESSGCKQSTITKFFGKIVPNVSQAGGGDAGESYKEEVNQFLLIINDAISRVDVTSILDKAKGDINMALEIYYSNSGGLISNNGGSAESRDEHESNIIEETQNMPNLSVNEISTGVVTSTFLSLPPEKYSPVEHACWRAGQAAPFLHLSRTFDLVERESGKIKTTGMLCNMFRSLLALSPEDVLPAVYLCINKIAPDHENMELNIGDNLVTAALEEACGTNKSKIREMYNNLGDLGDVAQVCRQTQLLLAPPCPLSIQHVFSVFRKISVESGNGSVVRKKNLVVNLMRSCREKEMKFLVRSLVRNLRIGAMVKTVLPALAQAVVMNSLHTLQEGSSETLRSLLQCISGAVVEAYNILPNLDLLVPSLLSKGIDFSSKTISAMPGTPIKPMLAKITNGVSQALKLFQGRAFTCEYKYDGQRAQIHKLIDGSVEIFSRSGDKTTSRFPDLVHIIKESCKPVATTFIIDAEVVAVDRKNDGKLMSFQKLSTRERGSKDSSIKMDNIKVDICAFVFDIMFANGEQLLLCPLRRRRQYLMDLFCEEKLGYFQLVKKITVEAEEAFLTSQGTLTKINSFLEDAFNSSCEGIMVKSLDVDAGYAASKRTDTWLKVKRDYVEGMNDSIDLVPIGAWHGNGRKAGWYSPFLMACYNPDTEEFQCVCRVMSGFSDSFYAEMKEFFSGEKIISKKPTYYQTAEVPDLWFSPELVWEIRGANFTISPVHQAAIGLVHPSQGISIRFPRFIRSVSDRKPEDCSTAADIANMFESQI